MNRIKCYFNSNYVDIKQENDIIHIISNSIEDGDIIDKKQFIKDIKLKKIFSNIFSNNIDIYLNHLIQEKDIIYYNSVFEELNCSKINIFDTSSKLKSPTLINATSNYILYFNNKYYVITPKILNTTLKLFKIKEIGVISKEKIPKNKDIKYYYYNYKNSYFIE